MMTSSSSIRRDETGRLQRSGRSGLLVDAVDQFGVDGGHVGQDRRAGVG
jgi:hypothetical protein